MEPLIKTELELPAKHPFDDKRLVIVVDIRSQSYDTPVWHLVEKRLRLVNPGSVWESDVHPVTMQQVIRHRNEEELLTEVCRLGPDEVMRRIKEERDRRNGEGWAVKINRWQTIWL